MSTTVHVEGISTKTSQKEVHDFFIFCGKISNLTIKPATEDTQNADVTFEKETAARTALLLDGTQLGPSQVKVTSASSTTGATDPTSPHAAEKGEHDDVAQEDKPKSRIVAEYLAHGYVISDKAIERAIALDKQHGISVRFTSALKAFDDRFKASDKAAAMDAKLGVTQKATAGWTGLSSYFEKALGTPTGQKVRRFYEEGNKQVVDVHNEARHLADLKNDGAKKPSAEEAGLHTVPGDEKRTQCNCGGAEGKCACEPGKCACSSCNLNQDENKKPTAEEAGLHLVPGDEKRTQCNCGGAEGKCACEPGKCACSNCNLNKDAAPPSAGGASANEKIQI